MRNVNVISLDRSGVGLSGLKSAMELLNEDQVVVIFPEGTTSDTGGLIKGRSGVSYLAIKSECPILPISITGTNHFPAWRLWMPLKKVHVNIGAVLLRLYTMNEGGLKKWFSELFSYRGRYKSFRKSS